MDSSKKTLEYKGKKSYNIFSFLNKSTLMMYRLVLFLCVIVDHNTYISALPRCEYRDFCNYNEARAFPSCYCDKHCIHYNDCCKEVFTAHASVNNSWSNLIDQSCIILTNQKERKKERIGAYMITKCQNSGTRCQTKGDLKGLLPVSKDEVTYLNAECAICNHIESFVSWGVLFHVPKLQSILSADNVSFGYIRNDYVLEYLLNTQSIMYYLQPPFAFRPRFCPFDFINSTYHGFNEYIHQNIVLCEGRLFKNNEECLKDGCCLTSFSLCHDLTLFQGNEENRYMYKTYVVVIVSASSEKREAQIQEKENAFAVSLLYMNLKITIFLKVEAIVNVKAELDNCIQSTISFLLALEYGLSKLQNYYYLWVQDERYHFVVNFESGLKLTASEANSLLQLDSVIHCHNKSTKQQTPILITGGPWMGYNHLEKHEDVKHRLIRSAKFKPSSANGMKLCDNASLVLNTVEAGILFHVECPENDDSSVRNKAQMRTEGSMSHYLFLNMVILSISNIFIV